VSTFGTEPLAQRPRSGGFKESFPGKGIADCFSAPDSPWEGVVITVCSRCKRTISQTAGEGSEKKVSHGICTRCLAIMEGEIRESSKAVEDETKPDAFPLGAEEP
jgi:hypothetical protein